MNEFLDILTHGRRLQGAVKELSIQELETVQEKLANIIDKRKEKALEEEKVGQEKRAKLEEIKKTNGRSGFKFRRLTIIK